jgi:hypothetical protein
MKLLEGYDTNVDIAVKREGISLAPHFPVMFREVWGMTGYVRLGVFAQSLQRIWCDVRCSDYP